MNYFGMNSFGPQISPQLGIALVVIILWELFWKGLALWRAAKRGEKVWFVLLLLLNTFGLLEIFYLFVIAKAKMSDFTTPSKE